MDAFFAAVEQRDNPQLQGKPVAVGHKSERGVVTTASYEARKFGVHSAQSMQVALRRCPQLIVVPPDFHRYKEVSQQIRAIFYEYTDLVEPLSIDEAFLDVTRNKKDIPMAVDIAREIKERIKHELHLTASAGVSYNKLLAKIASDMRKPDGLYVVHPRKAQDFIDALPIEKFWGIGPKTAARFHKIGVFTGEGLRQVPQKHLMELFGKAGSMYYHFARGIDLRPVEPFSERKSVGCEHTFETDIAEPLAVTEALHHTIEELLVRLEKAHFAGLTLTLKVKYADFAQVTRSVTVAEPLLSRTRLLPPAEQLLAQVNYSELHPIRLLGLSVSHPVAERKTTTAVWEEGWLPFEPHEVWYE